MPVSKEELFARYKQLKAEGVNISLVELKKQMEEGLDVVNGNVESTSTDNQVPKQNGFSALSRSTSETSGQTAQSSTTSGWTTSYSTQPKFEENNTLSQVSSPSSYSGNLNSETVYNSNYSNSFNADYFAKPVTPVLTQQEEPNPIKQPYTGNVPSASNVIAENSDNDVKKYALIGYPLGHSLSSYIHDAGFKSIGLNATYDILETPPDSLFERIKFLKSNNYSGFNVTIPLKLPVTMLLDEVDMSADIAGAVNTVIINPDKTMKGYNTDVIGFKSAIPSDVVLAGKVVGILGTGGAARAAITVFAQSQVKEIRLYTRNVPNSLKLVNFLRERFPNIEFKTLQIEYIKDLSEIDMLVNTTPIGMQGHCADMTPVEEEQLRTLPQGAIVYDVIYNPKKTLLLRLAQKNGYKIINGVDMFIGQALAAEQIWTGKTPDYKDMKIAALENL